MIVRHNCLIRDNSPSNPAVFLFQIIIKTKYYESNMERQSHR